MLVGVVGIVIILMYRGNGRNIGQNPAERHARFPDATVVTPERVALGMQQGEQVPSRKTAIDSPLSPVGTVFTVTVIDESATPLVGATVGLRRSSTSVPIDATDSLGQVRFKLTEWDGWCIESAIPGFSTARLRLLPSSAHDVTLRMFRASEISGTVRWKGGEKPAYPAIVCAYLDGYVPRKEDLDNWRNAQESSALTVVSTDADGHYRLAGLSLGRKYTLIAATDSGITGEQHVEVIPPAANQDITLVGFYAAQLHVRDLDGGELRASKDLYGRGLYWTGLEDGLSVIVDIPPEFLFLVSKKMWASSPRDSHDPLLLFRSNVAPVGSIKVQIDVDIPGYKAAWSTLTFEPVAEQIPEYTLRLQRIAQEWGRLRIRCSGTFADIVPDSPTNVLVGSMQLQAELFNGGCSVVIPVSKPCADEHVVDGLPYGSYSGVFSLRDWTPTGAKGEQVVGFTIGPNEAVIDLEYKQVGAIIVTLLDEWNTLYDGEAKMRVYAGASDAYFCFRCGPYVIDGLEPGKYTVAVTQAGGRLSNTGPHAEALVTAAGIAEATIRLPP